MQRNKETTIIFLSIIVITNFFIFNFISQGQSNEIVANRVIAAIDGEPITENDLRQYTASIGGKLPSDLITGKEEVQKYLQELIVAKLLEKEANGLNILVEDAEIDAYIKEVKKQNNFDDKKFETLLEERGLALEDYRIQVKRDIYRSRIISAVIRNTVNVSEEDIDRYLEANPQFNPKEGELHLEQVLLRIPPANDESLKLKAKTKLEEIKVLVKEGKKLRDVASDYYNDLGYVNLEDLRPEISIAVKDLNIGETSNVVVTDQGDYLFRVVAKGGEVTKDEILRESIKRELYEKQIKERMDRYVKEDLPKKYVVEVKL